MTTNDFKIIKDTILHMEKPFNVSDLLYTLESQGIKNRALILAILDELCDSGFLDYSEVNDDCWAFNVIKSA